MRLFFGFEPPIRVVEEVALAQEDLAEALHHLGGDVEWARPERMRLNLRVFALGPRADLPAVRDSVRAAVAGAAPLTLAVRGLRFGPDDSARLLLADVEVDAARVAVLRAQVEEALQPAGVEAESEPWVPVLQVARVRGGDRERLEPALRSYVGRSFGGGACAQLVLAQTDVDRTAVRYAVLDRFLLAG